MIAFASSPYLYAGDIAGLVGLDRGAFLRRPESLSSVAGALMNGGASATKLTTHHPIQSPILSDRDSAAVAALMRRNKPKPSR